MARSTTVSLVLGIGGARGLAHIGVIQWLTENGYDIRSIAGSSMGALVGGIYAASKLEVYTEWVSALERMQVVRLLDPAFGRSGLFKGERIMGVLRELIGDFDIENLPVSFTAVATDLESGEEVWLREGKLFDAICASIATPLIFTPFKHRGRMLLDGGLVNPVPIAPALNDTTELTVVVNLSGPIESRPPPLKRAPTPEDNTAAHPCFHREPAPLEGKDPGCARARDPRYRARIHGSDAEHDHALEARSLLARRDRRDTAQCLRLPRVLARAGADRARPRTYRTGICSNRTPTNLEPVAK